MTKNPLTSKLKKSPPLHDRRVKASLVPLLSHHLICNGNICLALSWLCRRNAGVLTQYLIKERLALCVSVSPLSLSQSFIILLHMMKLITLRTLHNYGITPKHFKNKTNQNQTFSLCFKFPIKYQQQCIFAWGKLPKSVVFIWNFLSNFLWEIN